MIVLGLNEIILASHQPVRCGDIGVIKLLSLSSCKVDGTKHFFLFFFQ